MSQVVEISSVDHFNQILTQAEQKPVFIEFYAVWCGPCSMIKPVFEELSEKFKGKAFFLKVNVDELEELSSKYSITAMPTFICLKGSKQVGMMKGADLNGLREFVNKYAIQEIQKMVA